MSEQGDVQAWIDPLDIPKIFRELQPKLGGDRCQD
jgi:hypothetical protein